MKQRSWPLAMASGVLTALSFAGFELDFLTWSSLIPLLFTKGVFRAVENRRFFIQAANTGISGVISPYGQIIARSSIEQEQVLYAEVALSDYKTIYTRFGEWLMYLAVFFLGTALARSKLRRSKIF